jgi:hypothetical protein
MMNRFTEDEFNFDKMNEILYNGKLSKGIENAKEYIKQFFHPTLNNNHIIVSEGKTEVINDQAMKNVYLSRFHKDIVKWYTSELNPKKVISDINKFEITNEYINVAGRMLYQDEQSFESFDTDIKERVQVMLDYIMLIWANNDPIVYEYLLNWFANMIQGNKNKSCIYAKGQEGIGKSTFPDFIVEFVLGCDLYTKGKADHLKGQHNSQLLGKLFVVFEELQTFSDKEWLSVDSELKDMITSDTMQYCDKYEKRFMEFQ